ncbi:MAG: hypothetical protein NKF70_00045 [Methanobacterium sp. ERen5]|nr:MAG: hypothetical protein NKF70_00045 [Methanobacterium sp. ERen5]
MTANLYYNKAKSNHFHSAPIFDDWKYKSEPSKAGLLTFKSPLYLDAGYHLKLVNEGEPLFGGRFLRKLIRKVIFTVTKHWIINITF